MNRFITMLLLATAVCTATGSVSAQEADRILGIYKVEGETTHELSKVRIYKTGDTYEARIIWLEHPNDEAGNPRLDLLNPDPALRSGRADAIVLVRGLRYDAKKERWTGGTIYNPVDGKCTTYRRNSMVRRSSGSGGISESPCSAETSSGKSWSNAYRSTNGKRRGHRTRYPFSYFPCRVHRIITGTRHPYGTRPRRMGAATDGMCRTERQGDGNKKHRALRALPTAPAIPSGPAAGTSIPADSSLRHVPDPAYGSVPAISLRWAGAIPPDRIRNPQAGHCKYGPETTAAAPKRAAAHLPIPKDYFR